MLRLLRAVVRMSLPCLVPDRGARLACEADEPLTPISGSPVEVSMILTFIGSTSEEGNDDRGCFVGLAREARSTGRVGTKTK